MSEYSERRVRILKQFGSEWAWLQALKLLYGYPDGRKKVAELAAAWRRDFPRRTAMLEELKKVKL